MKYFYVYKTRNEVDGKFYIGKHVSDKLQDDYLGSGFLLWRAIHKHGIENFKCITRGISIALRRPFLSAQDLLGVRQDLLEPGDDQEHAHPALVHSAHQSFADTLPPQLTARDIPRPGSMVKPYRDDRLLHRFRYRDHQ